MKIRFGPAGLGSPPEEGLQRCQKLGLEAAEVSFTYGVYMKPEIALKTGRLARKLGIKLSVHAPYYINLASRDPDKVKASKKRILESCERAHQMGAKYVVFHAGFYEKRPKNEIYPIIRDEIGFLVEKVKNNGWKVVLAPETTGKPTQFCGLDTLLELRKDTKCGICIDFAHLYARKQGKIDFEAILAGIPRFSYLHCHFSGINFTEKGEKSHKSLTKSRFTPLANAILKTQPGNITIISESPPDTFKEAAKMQRWFAEMKK